MKWQKSSYSTDAEGSNCIELAADRSEVRLRESERPDVVLVAGRGGLAALLGAVKGGLLDEL
ncbi:DUF397 domain-containing protein [Streptomyces sp. 549]|uniref:DUF397 domain-containing protein n=1 Tax=Streptomyces sp. 549 TaxID=3049076 RepID=UPI0024C44009|nr:DUF397 domain-containing protein [Streptomyces sp. 549]MDK1472573.1 DUF397 domain-containing protein [Streptomyces sp. 549]